MFQNQSYKQKLSFTSNENTNDVVNINIVLSTNHEIEKTIIKDIETIVSSMFLDNYTETEELVKEQKEEAVRLMREKQQQKESEKRQKEQMKQNEKMDRENERRQKEYAKADNNQRNMSRNWGHKKHNF